MSKAEYFYMLKVFSLSTLLLFLYFTLAQFALTKTMETNYACAESTIELKCPAATFCRHVEENDVCMPYMSPVFDIVRENS